MAKLLNWTELNKTLNLAGEQLLSDLLAQELAGPARVTHLLRIHARLNKLRARRERAELRGKAVGK
jgi:hypothetical protein